MRKIAGARHIVDAIVDHDTIRNQCIGSGKILVRLGEGEDLEQIKGKLNEAGLKVRETFSNASKRPTFTY